jgi:hypothetical protein
MKNNIFKYLALVLLTGCGSAFTASGDPATVSAAGSSGMDNKAGSSGGEASTAGSESGSGGSVVAGSSNGGSVNTTAGNPGVSGGGASAGFGGALVSGAGGTTSGAGGAIAGAASMAGAGGDPSAPKYCSQYITNYLCTKTMIDGVPANNLAQCPEYTTMPPSYLTEDPQHGHINNCTVKDNGLGKNGTDDMWCCTQPIKSF